MKRPRGERRAVPARSRGAAWGPIAAGLAVIAALLAGTYAWRALRPARMPGVAPDSAAALDGERALSEAYARVDRKQPGLSVPFFERALRALPPGRTDARVLYAAALQDLALGDRLRSSVERVAALREALRQLDVGVRSAADPEAGASLHFQRGYLLNVFGFPLDAMVELNVAASENPGSHEVSDAQVGLAARLRNPEDPRR